MYVDLTSCAVTVNEHVFPGGIRTAKDSLQWLTLMKEELGDEWVQPDLFRMGASSLLGDIERQLYHYCTGRYASSTFDIAM